MVEKVTQMLHLPDPNVAGGSPRSSSISRMLTPGTVKCAGPVRLCSKCGRTAATPLTRNVKATNGNNNNKIKKYTKWRLYQWM